MNPSHHSGACKNANLKPLESVFIFVKVCRWLMCKVWGGWFSQLVFKLWAATHQKVMKATRGATQIINNCVERTWECSLYGKSKHCEMFASTISIQVFVLAYSVNHTFSVGHAQKQLKTTEVMIWLVTPQSLYALPHQVHPPEHYLFSKCLMQRQNQNILLCACSSMWNMLAMATNKELT